MSYLLARPLSSLVGVLDFKGNDYLFELVYILHCHRLLLLLAFPLE